MELLYILPEITNTLNNDPNSIIDEVSKNIEILGFHIEPALLNHNDQRLYELLSHIYFIQGNYPLSIEFAIKADVKPSNDFFSKNLYYRILDEYRKTRDNKLLNYLGKFHRSFTALCQLPMEDPEDLVIYNSKFNYKNVLLTDGNGSFEFMKLYMDACIHYELPDRVNTLLASIPEGPMLYALCFYARDNSFLKFMHPSPNATFILEGKFMESLTAEFLNRNMRIDTEFLESSGRYFVHKNLITQTMFGLSMAFQSLGCGTDALFRINADIFQGCRSWSKFTVHAAQGMTFPTNGYEILQDILPNENSNKDGGGLLALGLAHVGRNQQADISFFKNFIAGEKEIIYGALLGMGLASLGSRDDKLTLLIEKYLEEEKGDIVNEGACIALGHVWVGSKNGAVIEKLRKLMRVSIHERVCRAAGVGIALIEMGGEQYEYNFNAQKDLYSCGFYANNIEGADSSCNEDTSVQKDSNNNIGGKKDRNRLMMHGNTSEEEFREIMRTSHPFVRDKMEKELKQGETIYRKEKMQINAKFVNKNWIFRYSHVLGLGCSYVGTGRMDVLSALLRYTRDLNGDVRRAAIFSIGLVFCRDTEKLWVILEPFLRSYCLYIKHAVCIALGLFFCGTGDDRVCAGVEVLLYDDESLVRQAACIGMGLLLMQNNAYKKNFKRIVERMNYIISKKHESEDARLGAMVGRSIMGAGGSCVIFSAFNLSGNLAHKNVLGFVMFFEFWFWYPYFSYLSLAFFPTSKFVFNMHLSPVSRTYTIKGYPRELDIPVVYFKESKRKRKSLARILLEKPNFNFEVMHQLNSSGRMWLKVKDRVGGFGVEFVDE